MFDAIADDQFPPGADAYAAYVDGDLANQPNYSFIVATFPSAEHLSITLFPDKDAECLDIENGAATPESAADWYERQRARGITRPALYADVSTMESDVVPVITAAKIARATVRLWTAHYGAGEHICGPKSCGALSIDADGTQWCDDALGRDLDRSLLLADFFGTPAPPAGTPRSGSSGSRRQAPPSPRRSTSSTSTGDPCATGQPWSPPIRGPRRRRHGRAARWSRARPTSRTWSPPEPAGRA
jgi:hypothetical protein